MSGTRQQVVLEEKDGCQTDLLQTIAAYGVVLGKLKNVPGVHQSMSCMHGCGSGVGGGFFAARDLEVRYLC